MHKPMLEGRCVPLQGSMRSNLQTPRQGKILGPAPLVVSSANSHFAYCQQQFDQTGCQQHLPGFTEKNSSANQKT